MQSGSERPLRDREHLDGFLELYNDSYGRLLAYCRRRTRSTADADDAVAETYLVAWRRLDDVMDADSPIAWLYGVAYRVLSNQRRSGERATRLTQRLRLQPLPVPATEPAQEVVADQEVAAVYSGLAELDPKDQEIIRLAALEELSYTEIGAALGIRAGTVRSRLFRARRRLEQLMADSGRDTDVDTETTPNTRSTADPTEPIDGEGAVVSDRDLFDLLRAGDPAPLDVTDSASSAHGRRTLATVMARGADQDIAHHRRRRRRLIAAITIIAALTTAAAWYLSTRPITDTGGTLCYDEPALDANAILVPFDQSPSVEACAQLWLNGDLPVEAPPATEIPDLIGCVLDSETLAVFPSTNETLCAQLGLTEPDTSVSIDPITELRDRLTASINQTTCLNLEQAQQQVRAHLIELGFTDWQITTQTADPARPCTSYGLDAANQTIILVPIPDA